MDESQTLQGLVRRAHEALDELGRSHVACPTGTDPFDWSADLLDELARVALGLGEAASVLTGGPDDVDARAHELATAIVRRRNDALAPARERLASRS